MARRSWKKLPFLAIRLTRSCLCVERTLVHEVRHEVHKILVWSVTVLLERCGYSLEDGVNVYLTRYSCEIIEWVYVVQDRVKMWAWVSTVMKFRVSKKKLMIGRYIKWLELCFRLFFLKFKCQGACSQGNVLLLFVKVVGRLEWWRHKLPF